MAEKKSTKKTTKKVFKEVAKKPYATLTIKQLSYLAFKLGCIDITEMEQSDFEKRFKGKDKYVLVMSLGARGNNGAIFQCNRKWYCILERRFIINYLWEYIDKKKYQKKFNKI